MCYISIKTVNCVKIFFQDKDKNHIDSVLAKFMSIDPNKIVIRLTKDKSGYMISYRVKYLCPGDEWLSDDDYNKPDLSINIYELSKELYLSGEIYDYTMNTCE